MALVCTVSHANDKRVCTACISRHGVASDDVGRFSFRWSISPVKRPRGYKLAAKSIHSIPVLFSRHSKPQRSQDTHPPKVVNKMGSLWDAIDDELYRLPPELKDPRFDSLRHVLNIVSSVNAESSVEEVSLALATAPPCQHIITPSTL